MGYSKILLLTMLALGVLSCSAVTTSEIQDRPGQVTGTWQLIDICGYTMMDSPPRGFPPLKYHFSNDGKLYIIKADGTLNNDTQFIPYTFQNSILYLSIPDRDTIIVPVGFIPPDRMVLYYGDRNVWTFEKMGGSEPYNEKLEPRSMAVLQTVNPADQLSNLDIEYDAADYSHLTLPERIVGVWEATSYSGIASADFPPYGFPNVKWIFTAEGKYFVLPPDEAKTKKGSAADFNILGNQITGIGPQDEVFIGKVSFNEWGHLEINVEGEIITFKLLSKDPKKIQKLPVKITLLKLKGE
jgi:hypothetical protein